MKRVAVIGSTGSIGTQTLRVIEAHPELFCAEVLTAKENAALLIEQALRFKPNMVAIANEEKYREVSEALEGEDIKVYAGEKAVAQVAAVGTVDVVVTATVGYSGLLPTIEAIRAGKTIALANKETLVVAGGLIAELLKEHRQASIVPVDSEHSAIFQCLAGEGDNPVEKVILTASGGPFRGKDAAFLSRVTPEMALNHPNWKMGAKVTIDSASLMNKGFEVMEARWLFGLEPAQIDVVVHPQSVIHSMVQFTDGSIKAQLGTPDMRLPIQYALTWPVRVGLDAERVDFAFCNSLTFEEPDLKTFRNLDLARKAMLRGGNMPCVLNAANEVAVAAFLRKEIPFTKMPELIEQTMEASAFVAAPELADYAETDREARKRALGLIGK